MEEQAEKIFTVTELNQRVKLTLEGTFPELWVSGEISNLKIAASGHTYFDLKDSDSVIAAVFFRGYAGGIKFRLDNGLTVLVKAQLTSYIKQGKYQLLVKEVQPKSIGPLQLAFEQLKKKLADEGLFDEGRKRPIPKFPRKIGVVTSLQGAAIRDILSILKRRCPNLHIIIAPVKVQGDGAKEEIAQAIEDLNTGFPDIDVLLVGRGGGSMEDLWSFNEEIVARAIASSKIPVISCVGHETDFTIADFVADLRAPTPSAAAELVVRSKEEITGQLVQMERRLLQSLRIFYERLKGRLEKAAACRFFKNPALLWQDRAQRVDELLEQMILSMERRLSYLSETVKARSEKLHALSPTACLARGYSITRNAGTGEILTDASGVKPGEKIYVQLSKGKIRADVETTDIGS